MNEHPPPTLTLTGKRVYSPAVLAAYTLLANLPYGIILYGLNVRARGQRSYGTAISLFGAAVLLPFVALTAQGVRFAPLFLAAFGAINVYLLEQRPFQRALAQGATRARWWPPLLPLIALGVVAVAFEL